MKSTIEKRPDRWSVTTKTMCSVFGSCESAADIIASLQEEVLAGQTMREAMIGLAVAHQTHKGWFVRITNRRKVWYNHATDKWAFLMLDAKKSCESDIISEHDTMAEAIIAAREWNLERKP